MRETFHMAELERENEQLRARLTAAEAERDAMRAVVTAARAVLASGETFAEQGRALDKMEAALASYDAGTAPAENSAALKEDIND